MVFTKKELQSNKAVASTVHSRIETPVNEYEEVFGFLHRIFFINGAKTEDSQGSNVLGVGDW